MAKEVVIKARLDTQDSVSQIQKMKRELATVGNENIDERFNKINKAVEKGTLSVSEMKRAIREYQTIALEAGQTSPIGVEALARAGQLKDMLIDTQSQIKIMAQDGKVLNASVAISGTVINGYQSFIGLTQLASGENKKLLETMAKMQIVMQTLNAIEQVTNQLRKGGAVHTYALIAAKKALTFVTDGASLAMKGFRAALISTGIGTIVVAIGYLIAKFDDLVGWIKRVTGLTNEEAEANKRLADSYINSARQLSDNIEKEYARRVKILKAQGKDTYEIEKQALEAKLKLRRHELQLFILQTKIMIANGDLETEAARERLKQLTERVNEIKDLYTDLQVLQIERNNNVQKANEEERKKWKEHYESLKKERLEFSQFVQGLNKLDYKTPVAEIIMQTREELMVANSLFMEDVAKAKEAITDYTLSTVGSFGNIFNSLADMQVKGSAAQKRLALMSIVASQAESIAHAVVAASKSARDVKDPTGLLRPVIWVSTFASITAGIMASVAQAKRVLGESGGGGGISVPRAGGSASATTGTQEQEQTVSYENPAGQEKTTKVVVVESDITRVQNNVNYAKRIAVI